MDLKNEGSCIDFPTDSTTSSKSCGGQQKRKNEISEPEPSCSNVFSTSSSTSSAMSPGFFQSECNLQKSGRQPHPNIGYEMAVAKSIMKQYSTLSGDNLFDHISDLIKRVIDERPPNVIDFFEEFSRNVREQKFHLPEKFPPDGIYDENRYYKVAKKILLSMKLPMEENQNELLAPDEMSVEDLKALEEIRLDIYGNARLFKTFNERVQQLQFFWNQCGFSISEDDIFQLACSMDRLQTHPSITQCRFWGIVNGLKMSYYIVEASLTQEEIRTRVERMEQEMRDKQPKLLLMKEEHPLPPHIGPELTPGINGWESYSAEELSLMQPTTDPVPIPQIPEVFDVPPEPVGLGTNRYSYFAVNTLSEDWIELPIVTPKQIVVSRLIKKFFTGDLEAEITSYPCFPGKEKHYLRTMIARITAGTYIAPEGYFRKITKREKRLYDGEIDEEMIEEEEEEQLGEEDNEIDNDVILLKNEKYEPKSLQTMISTSYWVHVRPNILRQGRIAWFDEEKARKEREKEIARLLKLQALEEMAEEEEEMEEENEEEGEEEELLEDFIQPETGPPILNPLNADESDEYTVPWIARFTSKYTNKNERILIMHSNTWPGAFTFTFENTCESIYMGWGHKYTSRNIAFSHLPAVGVEYVHGAEDFIEALDPTVEMEEAVKQWLLRKQQDLNEIAEHVSEFDDNEDVESSIEDV